MEGEVECITDVKVTSKAPATEESSMEVDGASVEKSSQEDADAGNSLDESIMDDNVKTRNETSVRGESLVEYEVESGNTTPVRGESLVDYEVESGNTTPARGESPMEDEVEAGNKTPVPRESPVEDEVEAANHDDAEESPMESVETSQEQTATARDSSKEAEGMGLLLVNSSVKRIYTLLFKVMNARERVQKRLAARKNPFFCTFCKIELREKGKFLEHYKSTEHRSTMATTLKNLANLIGRFYIAIQDAAFQDSNRGNKVSMCRLCLMPHRFKPAEHLQSAEHKLGIRLVKLPCRTCEKYFDNRIEMEKHLGGLMHVRNHFKNFKGLLLDADVKLPELDPDDDEPPGSHYIYDDKGFHCSVCNLDIKGSNNDFDMYDHCKTKTHYDNYKCFLQRKATAAEDGT